MIEHYKELRAYGRKLIDDHGLRGWEFSVENCQNPFRSGADNGVNGFCNHLEKLIAIDNKYLGHPRAARQVILHEIAHALLGPAYRVFGGHGPKFCKLARKLGCRTDVTVGQYEWVWRYRHYLAGTPLAAKYGIPAK